ncbi:MAG: biopolymer transporter ExbD [Deltaproteobacteria bacterium]|jgi:biopolymer transport protein ExbD|nr:biopolymer transporter ExbD [Deltaproteobacteria bacterium]
MAGQSTSDSDDAISAINVTPFVDIVLVLLIILMVTSTEIVRASLKVELPKAASGGELVDTTLNIVVTKDGDYYLDGAQVTEEQIVERIKTEQAANTKLQAVIAADRGVVYGRVVRVIDLIKKNGVTGFALNIEREAGSP